MNFQKMTVGKRLALGFGLVLLLLGLVMLIGVHSLRAVGNLSEQMVGDVLVKQNLITEWHGLTEINGVRTLAVVENADPAVQAKLDGPIKAASQRITEIQKALAAMKKSDVETAIYADIALRRDDYRGAREAVFKEKKAGNLDAAKKIAGERLEPALTAYLGAIGKLTTYQSGLIQSLSAEIQSRFSGGQQLSLGLGIAAILIGIAAAWLVSRGLLQMLGGEPTATVAIAGRIAAGDLNVPITLRPNDRSSLLFAISSMRDNLGNIVAQVRSSTERIASGSSEIASGNLDLSSRTEQQASALGETATRMGELTSTVRQNADNARQANSLAASASEMAMKGGAVVSEVVTTMSSINESSRKIVDIIGVIDSIAFQTNILALNAAVEAARAGEQGRGFAVVAAEVRNLAQRSAGAAKEIKALIGDSVDKVDLGTRLVDQAGSTMTDIVDSVKRVTDIISEISAASGEQTTGIDQINTAITEMDQVTQQNAALVEEAAAAAEAMQHQAGQLEQVVSIFQLAAQHRADTVASPPARPVAVTRRVPAPRPKASPTARVNSPATGRGVPVSAPAPAPAAQQGGDWEEF